MKFSALFAISIALLTQSAPALASEPTHRVLIIGIDGCRPDALEAAETPHIDSLAANGTWFEGTDIRQPVRKDDANTVSGPGWSNLLTGVWPDKHGIIDNKFKTPNYDRYPHVFARIKEARPKGYTASYSSWPPIARTITRGADEAVNFPAKDPEDLAGYVQGDVEASAAAIQCLKARDPDCLVLYLGQVDETGHKFGFHPNVAEYIASMERVDTHIGDVMAAVRNRTNAKHEDWLTIVCTDHGGSGTDHGDGHNNPEIRRTFLIVSGRSAMKGRSQTQTWQVDVAPTALKHLGIEPNPEWELDGRAVGLK
jgi:predicted AlkP superfamily pyrophosphatase or phosphodiesterase